MEQYRFLCDEMLQRLGRWLRAAGYDTLVECSATADRLLLARARRERRRLLTRDHQLIEHRGAPGTVVLLYSNQLEDCVAELTQRLSIDWLHRPFSRCIRCNTPLRSLPGPVAPQQAASFCPACEQLFWEGGHVRRMRARLRAWNGAASAY